MRESPYNCIDGAARRVLLAAQDFCLLIAIDRIKRAEAPFIKLVDHDTVRIRMNIECGILPARHQLRLLISLILDSVASEDLIVNCIGISVKGLSVWLHALSCGQWLHILPLPGGGYRVRVSAFLFHAGMACVRRTAVIEFLPFEILPLFRIELGRDKRGLGARSITDSVSADAPARTAAPAMSAMSVMFFIYIVVFFWFLHAYNSRLIGARIWDQSPTLRHVDVEARAASAGMIISPSPKRSFPREKTGLPRNKRPVPTLN